MTEYSIQYFIDRFSAIPEEHWLEGHFTSETDPTQHCAYGHCGCTPDCQENLEANTLDRLFRDHKLNVAEVNDAVEPTFRYLPTPKQRILAALESFK